MKGTDSFQKGVGDTAIIQRTGHFSGTEKEKDMSGMFGLGLCSWRTGSMVMSCGIREERNQPGTGLRFWTTESEVMPITRICWTEGRAGVTGHDHEFFSREKMFEMCTTSPGMEIKGVSQDIPYLCLGFTNKYGRTKYMWINQKPAWLPNSANDVHKPGWLLSSANNAQKPGWLQSSANRAHEAVSSKYGEDYVLSLSNIDVPKYNSYKSPWVLSFDIHRWPFQEIESCTCAFVKCLRELTVLLETYTNALCPSSVCLCWNGSCVAMSLGFSSSGSTVFARSHLTCSG